MQEQNLKPGKIPLNRYNLFPYLSDSERVNNVLARDGASAKFLFTASAKSR